ncbi:MAG: hypothetical protein NVSMB2_06800 [Chloroflexota bacterium]
MMKFLFLVALLIGVGAFGLARLFPAPQSADPQVTTAAVSAPTAAPRAGQQSVEISEDDLNARLNSRMAGQQIGQTPLGPATLQRITTQLRNGQLTATGDASVASTTVPVSVSGNIKVQGERPVVVVDDVRSAGVPMPSATRDSVQSALQTQLDAEVQRLGVRVSSVTIADGVLRLVGSRL